MAAFMAERLEHAGVLLVHVWPEVVGTPVGVALRLDDDVVVVELRARRHASSPESEGIVAEVRVRLGHAADAARMRVDLARAELARAGGCITVRLPLSLPPTPFAEGTLVSGAAAASDSEAPAGRDAVRERSGFELRAASLRRLARERAARASALHCARCGHTLVERWDGRRLAPLPRVAAHELADVTCACEGAACEPWAHFRGGPAAGEAAAAQTEPTASAPTDADALDAARRAGAAAAAGARRATRTLYGDHWLLLPNGSLAHGALRPPEAAVPRPAELVFRGAAHVPSWTSGLSARAPPSKRARRAPAAGARAAPPREQEWTLARCGGCGAVVGARQASSPPRAALAPPAAIAAVLGLGLGGLVGGLGGLVGGLGGLVGGLGGLGGDVGGACGGGGGDGASSPAPLALADAAHSAMVSFGWFEHELTAYCTPPTPPPLPSPLPAAGRGLGGADDGDGDGDAGNGTLPPPIAFAASSSGAAQLLTWRVRSERAAAVGGCADGVGALGAALLSHAEEGGGAFFELEAAGDDDDGAPSDSDVAPAALPPPAIQKGRRRALRLQILSLYGAALRGAATSKPDAGATAAAAARGVGGAVVAGCDAAPSEGAGGEGVWQDTLRVLYALDEPIASRASESTAAAAAYAAAACAAAEPAAESAAVSAWRARAGASLRTLRVLDRDWADALQALRASSARLPPGSRELCGLAIGHLPVTPCL